MSSPHDSPKPTHASVVHSTHTLSLYLEPDDRRLTVFSEGQTIAKLDTTRLPSRSNDGYGLLDTQYTTQTIVAHLRASSPPQPRGVPQKPVYQPGIN